MTDMRSRESVIDRISEAKNLRDILESDPVYSKGEIFKSSFLDHFVGILPDDKVAVFEKVFTEEAITDVGAEEVKLGTLPPQKYYKYIVQDESEKNNAIRTGNVPLSEILQQTFFSVLLDSIRVEGLFYAMSVEQIVRDTDSNAYFYYVGQPKEDVVDFEQLNKTSNKECVEFISSAMETLSFLQSILNFRHGEFMISSVFWDKTKKEVVVEASRKCRMSLTRTAESDSYDAALFFTSIADYYFSEFLDDDGEEDDRADEYGNSIGVGLAKTCQYIYDEYEAAYLQEQEAANAVTEKEAKEFLANKFPNIPSTNTSAEEKRSAELFDMEKVPLRDIAFVKEVSYLNDYEEDMFQAKIFSEYAFLRSTYLLRKNVASCSPAKLLEVFLSHLDSSRPTKKPRLNYQNVNYDRFKYESLKNDNLKNDSFKNDSFKNGMHVQHLKF